MGNNKSKKNTTKNSKKLLKNRKTFTLKLDSGDKIQAKTTYMEDTECFEINDIDIHKIRVSDKNALQQRT